MQQHLRCISQHSCLLLGSLCIASDTEPLNTEEFLRSVQQHRLPLVQQFPLSNAPSLLSTAARCLCFYIAGVVFYQGKSGKQTQQAQNTK